MGEEERGRTEVELVKDRLDQLRRLRRRLAVQLRPLATELVRLVFPRLEGSRVDDGRLNNLSAREYSPGNGVRAGSGVGAEVTLLVDGVVGDGRAVVEDVEELVDVLGRAEELDVGLFERAQGQPRISDSGRGARTHLLIYVAVDGTPTESGVFRLGAVNARLRVDLRERGTSSATIRG